ncbi:uncharacterized protein BYT42DRAFT_563325 [Radiomyces spectabilis]|uniref:uncharacterized protein n=1 Tax=Radiomyces spectabilis TaxID=64574 RepID=UPI00221E7AFA|nr:uncharacterized protein BYT42DRAFT_563325 [Radiomyces spectabilis]KAI8384689.1 hypothetical protein BYT42DRAFT_563325 [Radiomyces spectabilis]
MTPRLSRFTEHFDNNACTTPDSSLISSSMESYSFLNSSSLGELESPQTSCSSSSQVFDPLHTNTNATAPAHDYLAEDDATSLPDLSTSCAPTENVADSYVNQCVNPHSSARPKLFRKFKSLSSVATVFHHKLRIPPRNKHREQCRCDLAVSSA